MMRVPVHKGIGKHSAPVEILSWSASRRLEPSDPICHNTGTTTAVQRLEHHQLEHHQAVPTGSEPDTTSEESSRWIRRPRSGAA
jgi:hypothetical protein